MHHIADRRLGVGYWWSGGKGDVMPYGDDIDVEERENNPGALAYSKSQEYEGSEYMYGRLCYCIRSSDAGRLVFVANDFLKMWFSWADDVADLDIYAYWEGCRNEQSRGYGHEIGDMNLHKDGKVYMLAWSDDYTGSNQSEWLGFRPLIGQKLIVHLNFYGDVEEGASTVCSVSLKYLPNNTAITLTNVACGAHRHEAAQTRDPFVTVEFQEVPGYGPKAILYDDQGNRQELNCF